MELGAAAWLRSAELQPDPESFQNFDVALASDLAEKLERWPNSLAALALAPLGQWDSCQSVASPVVEAAWTKMAES